VRNGDGVGMGVIEAEIGVGDSTLTLIDLSFAILWRKRNYIPESPLRCQIFSGFGT
jgi:hypothetical protein